MKKKEAITKFKANKYSPDSVHYKHASAMQVVYLRQHNICTTAYYHSITTTENT